MHDQIFEEFKDLNFDFWEQLVLDLLHEVENGEPFALERCKQILYSLDSKQDWESLLILITQGQEEYVDIAADYLTEAINSESNNWKLQLLNEG
ncbi:hypothetical protein SD81_028185 [Tolypothrix campylonemoides VB511288]|nr:hypothetical protein SD81_028185 [Tolypothrix campylonemoides VB511288]